MPGNFQGLKKNKVTIVTLCGKYFLSLIARVPKGKKEKILPTPYGDWLSCSLFCILLPSRFWAQVHTHLVYLLSCQTWGLTT